MQKWMKASHVETHNQYQNNDLRGAMVCWRTVQWSAILTENYMNTQALRQFCQKEWRKNGEVTNLKKNMSSLHLSAQYADPGFVVLV